MHRLPLLAVLALSPVLTLIGCTGSGVKPHQMGPAPTTTEGQIAGRSAFQLPTIVPGTGVRMVPFIVEEQKTWFDDRDPYATRGFAASARVASENFSLAADASSSGRWSPGARGPQPHVWGSSVRWHNCIFKDLVSGEEWPLIDRRGVISRWFGFGVSPDGEAPPVCHALLFFVTTEDTNRDGNLTDMDASVAILTDATGRNARPITPANAQVWNAVLDFPAASIHLLVVSDTNADGVFDALDTPVPYTFKAEQPGPAIRLISDDTQRRIEAILK